MPDPNVARLRHLGNRILDEEPLSDVGVPSSVVTSTLPPASPEVPTKMIAVYNPYPDGSQYFAQVFPAGAPLPLFEVWGENGKSLRAQGDHQAPAYGYLIVRDPTSRTGHNVLRIESHPTRPNSMNIVDVERSVLKGSPTGMIIDLDRPSNKSGIFQAGDKTPEGFGPFMGDKEIVGVVLTYERPQPAAEIVKNGWPRSVDLAVHKLVTETDRAIEPLKQTRDYADSKFAPGG